MQAVLDGVRRIVQALRASSRWAERHVGLSGAQLFVLQKLAETPGISVNELAERTHTHQSSVSVVVSRLAALDLVTRTRSAADGRRVELSLAPRARRVVGRAPGRRAGAADPRHRAAAAGAPARAGGGPRRSGDGDAGRRQAAAHVLRGAHGRPSGSPEGCPWLIHRGSLRAISPFRIGFTSRPGSPRSGHDELGDFTMTRRVLWLALLAIGLGVVSTLLAKGLLRADRAVHQPVLLPAIQRRAGVPSRHAARSLAGSRADRWRPRSSA